MDLIVTDPGIRVEVDRLNRQFRSLCRAQKVSSEADDTESERVNQSTDDTRPFGFMYNLFQWAVIIGAKDGQKAGLSGSTEVPFRWSRVPDTIRHRLLAIAMLHELRDDDLERQKKKAEELLSMPREDLSERLRVVLEQLANRGLQLMDVEVATESPDAYRTVENLVDTIAAKTE